MPGINRDKKIQRMEETMKMAAEDQPMSRFRGAIQTNRVSEDINKLLHLDDESATLIHRENIYPNPFNKPYMEGIDETVFEALKFSIIDMGLVHNLLVLEDGHGKYRLISGEKRWTAITRMTPEEYQKLFSKGILCKVIPHINNLSETDEKIMILTANVLVFSSGTPDLRQLRDLISLYTEKGYDKKELVDFLRGFFEKNIATIYRMVDEANAIKELVDLCDAKRMSRAALQCLGGLKKEEQKEAYKKIVDNNNLKIDEKLAQEIKRSIKASRKKGSGTDGGIQENSVAFLKMKKSLDIIITNIDKGKKMGTKDMNKLEKEVALAKIDKIRTELKELEEELKKTGKE